MSNRHQQKHLRQQQHELIQAFADAGQVTIPTKDHRRPKENAATCNPDVRKSDSPPTGSDHISLNGLISGIAPKTMNKTSTGDTKKSAEAIAAACIETIESANESFTVANATSITTASGTNGTSGDTDNASSSLSKLFSKKQPGGGYSETECQQSETTTDAPSGSGMPKRRDSVLDMFKKRMSSLNLSEEEYGKANEKTEFDTDSDSDSDDDDDNEHGDADINPKVKKNGGGDDSIGLDIFGGDSRFAIADDGWVSFSNQAA